MNDQSLTWEQFEKVDMRIGTISHAQLFPEARKPAYKLTIDFGNDIGIRNSSAQITDLYNINELVDKQVVAVVNFPPKQIGPFISECLVLGCYNEDGSVILLQPDALIKNGSKVG